MMQCDSSIERQRPNVCWSASRKGSIEMTTTLPQIPGWTNNWRGLLPSFHVGVVAASLLEAETDVGWKTRRVANTYCQQDHFTRFSKSILLKIIHSKDRVRSWFQSRPIATNGDISTCVYVICTVEYHQIMWYPPTIECHCPWLFYHT